MQQTIFITGANRGIGFELTKQYLDLGNTVIATCRNPSNAKALLELKLKFSALKIYKLDVTDFAAINKLAVELKDQYIDILINNAGILLARDEEKLDNIEPEIMINSFITNSIGPLKVSAAFRQHVAKSKAKVIAAISSNMGSIAGNDYGGYHSYRASKVALSSIMKNLALDVAQDGIKVILLDPGWVKTDMGTLDAPTAVTESVQGLIKVIAKQAGSSILPFVTYQGKKVAY